MNRIPATRRLALASSIIRVAARQVCFVLMGKALLPVKVTEAAEIADRALEGAPADIDRDAAQSRCIEPRRPSPGVDAIQEGEAQFRALADSMPQIVWSTRPDGRHDYFNRKWFEFTGTKADEAEGEGWNDSLHPEDRSKAFACWRHSLETGVAYEIEYRLRRADGAYRWMLARALPFRNAETGAIARWFGTCTDIEEKVAARLAMARSNEDLERLVEERTRALRDTQSKLALSERMQALGQLAGGIAHDFNNVLHAIRGCGGLILRSPGDEATVRKLATLLVDAAERGAAITRRLLAFSRRDDLRAEPVDAATLLEGMRAFLAPTLGARIEIVVDAPGELPPLLADKSQLETVLVNLATNARDAMEGHGTLRLSAGTLDAGAPGHPRGLPHGRYVWLRVTDGGVGMDAETLARATEPLFTTKEPGKGTGLGLSMALAFAEQSGGALHIDSEPGRGTVVTLWLPLARARATDATRDASPMERAANGARIMVVDDDGDVLEILARQLEAAGHVVVASSGAAAALSRLDGGERVDLLVTDLNMPGMDGADLIREARRREPGLPAIVITGSPASPVEAALGNSIGKPWSVVGKPIDEKGLSAAVAELLERSATR